MNFLNRTSIAMIFLISSLSSFAHAQSSGSFNNCSDDISSNCGDNDGPAIAEPAPAPPSPPSPPSDGDTDLGGQTAE